MNGHLYLYYHKVTMDPVLDVFEAFTLDGMGLARGDDTFHFERLKAPDGTYELWKGNEPGFGAWVQPHDGWLYLWGCIQPESKSAGEEYLARVRPDDIEDVRAYEYLVEAPTLADPDGEAPLVDDLHADGHAVRPCAQRAVVVVQPVPRRCSSR